MIDDATRERVRRIAAQRLAQKQKGVQLPPVDLVVKKELVPDRPQTTHWHYADLLTDRQKQRQA